MGVFYLFAVAGTASNKWELSYILEQATIEAKIIIIFLFAFSILVWTVMVSKGLQMQRARNNCRDGAAPDVRGDPSECGETLGIIRPIFAVRPDVGIAGPRVEVRRIDGENIQPIRGAVHQMRRAAEQRRDFLRHRGVP